MRSNSGFDSEGGLSGDMVSPSQDTADAAPADAFPPSAPVPAPAPAPAPGSAPAPYYDVASGAVGDDDDGWDFVATVVSKPAVAIPAANTNSGAGGATGAGGGAGAGLSALLPPSKYAADGGGGGSGDSSSATVGEAVDVVAKVFSPALEEVR